LGKGEIILKEVGQNQALGLLLLLIRSIDDDGLSQLFTCFLSHSIILHWKICRNIQSVSPVFNLLNK